MPEGDDPGGTRRKVRHLRADDVPDDDLVLLRAAPADRERTIRNLVDDARDSAATYAVEASPGRLEILHAVSVFARRAGVDDATVLARFRSSPSVVEMSVGDLRRAGFEVWPTGTNPDHYDLQLVRGRRHGADAAADDEELRVAAARLVMASRGQRPNPGYAGG